MMELLAHNLAPVMFASLVVFLLLGYPVAFALAANGIFFGLIGIELGLVRPELFQALPERVWGGMGIVMISDPALFIYGQKLDVPAMLGMALIVLGVVVIQLFSKTAGH